MKTLVLKLLVLALVPVMGVSCMTTYDAYGNPVQSVSPEGAAAMAIGAAVVGAAVANRNNNKRNDHYYNGYGHGGYGYGRNPYYYNNPRHCHY